MFEAGRILVPVDGSEPSRAAYAYAIALARRLHATLEVIHFWDTPDYVPPSLAVAMAVGASPMTVESLAKSEAYGRLESFLASVDRPRDVETRIRLEFGDPFDGIIAASKNVDLVVMGTHGRTGVDHFFIGSVAEKVVRHCPRPVLTVRGHRALWARQHLHEDDASPIRRILVGLDFSQGSRAALDAAIAIAERFDSSIGVLHAIVPPPIDALDVCIIADRSGPEVTLGDYVKAKAEEELGELLAGVARAKPLVEVGRAADAIIETARKDDYDLIVTGARGKRAIERFLLGSVAEKVLRRGPSPVLVVPPTC
jgi:nucleotide-binding universal stress UspA family protein